MSKTFWVLVILVALAGLAIGFIYQVSPIQIAQQIITNPTQFMADTWLFVQQHWQALIAGISGFFGALTLASRAYSNYKQQSQQQIKNIQEESTQTISQLSTEKQNLETQLSTANKAYSENIQTISANYTKVQEQLQDEITLNKQLTEERNYYYNQCEKLKKLEEQTKKPAPIP